MQINTEVTKLMQEIQKECHQMSDDLAASKLPELKKALPQDFTNVYLFTKLAEIELRLRKLETATKRTEGYLDLHTPLI